jgi:hypothetical protein
MRLAPASLLLASAVALAACQTPREACPSQGSRELRTVESLIRETQGNLSRGYALETRQEVDVIRTTCEVKLDDGTTGRVPCDRTDVDEVQRPVAIDLRAERAKLDSLVEQRSRLLARREAQVAACVAAHPE